MRRNRYALAIALFMAVVPAIADGATVPAPSNMWTSYISGRQARLHWNRVSISGTAVHYEVYRDDVKLATVIDGQKDPETDGDVWYFNTNHQYYVDNSVWPGKTHTYTVIAKAAEESSAAITRDLAIPIPSIANIWSSYSSGRSGYIQWTHMSAAFPDIKYQVFRDEVKLAEFQARTNGDVENGDRWDSTANFQYYYDNSVWPGNTHAYKVVATLFEGHDTVIEIETTLTIPVPSIPNLWSYYTSGRSGYIRWTHLSSSFPDIKYQVFRDEVKLAEFQARTNGDAENGDRWESNVNYQYYYDNSVWPGKTHTYKVVATLFEGHNVVIEIETTLTIPVPSIPNLWSYYSSGRSGYIRWTHLSSSFPNIKYQVFRDEVKLAEFQARTNGDVENGDRWDSNENYQYYYDNSVWPGKTHTYKVVATLFEGHDAVIEIGKELTVPTPISGAPNFTYQNQRNVQLYWTKIPSHPTFDIVRYTVYRDDVKLAEFDADTQGAGTNNDSWSSNASYQYYVDGTAVPYQTHVYRLEARLFADCQVAQEKTYTVPGPKVVNPSPTVMSVDSVRLNLGVSANSFPDATLEVYRDGQQIAALTPANNYFPTTFLDSGIDVPNGSHYYQFLFNLYPGCDSGMSEQFPLTVLMPVAPTLSVVKNEPGAVTLRCAGANITVAQYYEVYRDGTFVAATGTGTSVEYMDTGFESGRLVTYEARTRFVGFPASYESSKSAPLHIVTKLNPDQVLNVVSPFSSNVSPAWIDGDSSTAYLPMELEIDGVKKGAIKYYNDKSWYADAMGEPAEPKGIPLDPNRPVEIKFTVRPNETMSIAYGLNWTAIDLNNHTVNEPALHIRKGDSLLLTAQGTGALLEIDADGDGIYELSGIPGQKLPVAFNTSGVFTVTARIDGSIVGSINVAVASVTMSRELYYVASTVPNSSYQIAIRSEQPFTQYTELQNYFPPFYDLALLNSGSTATERKHYISSSSQEFINTALQTRLYNFRGPLVAECEVRVIVQNIEGRSYSPVLREYADGSLLLGNSVTLTNPFPGLSQKLTLTNAGPIFADTGTSTRIVAFDEYDKNGQANIYIISTPTGSSSAGYTIKTELLVDAN